jgi:hypothetical protein
MPRDCAAWLGGHISVAEDYCRYGLLESIKTRLKISHAETRSTYSLTFMQKTGRRNLLLVKSVEGIKSTWRVSELNGSDVSECSCVDTIEIQRYNCDICRSEMRADRFTTPRHKAAFRHFPPIGQLVICVIDHDNSVQPFLVVLAAPTLAVFLFLSLRNILDGALKLKD